MAALTTIAALTTRAGSKCRVFDFNICFDQKQAEAAAATLSALAALAGASTSTATAAAVASNIGTLGKSRTTAPATASSVFSGRTIAAMPRGLPEVFVKFSCGNASFPIFTRFNIQRRAHSIPTITIIHRRNTSGASGSPLDTASRLRQSIFGLPHASIPSHCDQWRTSSITPARTWFTALRLYKSTNTSMLPQSISTIPSIVTRCPGLRITPIATTPGMSRYIMQGQLVLLDLPGIHRVIRPPGRRVFGPKTKAMDKRSPGNRFRPQTKHIGLR